MASQLQWSHSPHRLNWHWLKDMRPSTGNNAYASAQIEIRSNTITVSSFSINETTRVRDDKLMSTYPSPSNRIVVSPNILSTKPTVVFSLQSMPSRHDSSISFKLVLSKYADNFGDRSLTLRSVFSQSCCCVIVIDVFSDVKVFTAVGSSIDALDKDGNADDAIVVDAIVTKPILRSIVLFRSRSFKICELLLT